MKLYRKDNNGNIRCWYIVKDNDTHYYIHHGILGKAITIDYVKAVQQDINKEIKSRYAEKRKQGYTSVDEVRDDVDDIQDLINYLNTYLSVNLNNENNNNVLPMLAKTYNGNFWKHSNVGYGQYKINGLRCIISAYIEDGIFGVPRLKFQSREGIEWKSLFDLEVRLIGAIPKELLQRMIDDEIKLDGEIYLPGYPVNEINHFVKNITSAKNSELQFWCYDLIITDTIQHIRDDIRNKYFHKYDGLFKDINEHLLVDEPLVNVPSFMVLNDNDALTKRDEFINLGFEGLIIRNPAVDYQFGRRRVGYMEKYKDKTDGKFVIIAIDKEVKRDLPIITCRNDVNYNTFETRFSYPHDVQKRILDNKDKYIGKEVFIKFGERSGVSRVPFHIKEVYLLDAEV